MFLTNSIVFRFFSWLFRSLKNIYLNSRFHSIFNRRLKPSRSVIIRKLMDEDMASQSKIYNAIDRSNIKKQEAKANNSLFLNAIDAPIKLMRVVGLGISLVFLVTSLNSILRSYILVCFGISLIALSYLMELIIKKDICSESLIIKFFKYAYSDGGLKNE